MGSVSRCAVCAIAVIKGNDVRFAVYILGVGEDRCDCLLPVKQECSISDMTDRKECFTDMPVKPDKDFFIF